MEFTVGRTRVKFCFAFAAAVTLLLLTDNSGTCALSLAACVLHESGHLLCMLILGEKPQEVKLSYYGVSIKKRGDMQEPGDEILVALGGPAVNFVTAALLFFFAHGSRGIVMNAVMINLCIGGFNMLPCLPLDAGRALCFAFSLRWGELRAVKIMRTVSFAALVPVFCAGLFVFFECEHNFTLLAAAVYILIVLISTGEKTVAKLP